MSEKIFVEENRLYKINCNMAEEIVELHDCFHRTNVLSDVDLIIFDESNITLMEYKNSTVANATNPEAFEFKLNEDKHYTKIARKYYDSLIYINNRTGWGNKNKSYYYVIECSMADSVVRKMLAGKIKKKLPFDLQDDLQGLKQTLIDHFEVVNMVEWNNKFPDYKFEAFSNT